jgi:hypothetical protein
MISMAVMVMMVHVALLLTGFFYFVYQGFRLIWFRLIYPSKIAQALPDSRQCGLKKIFFQSNVYIRVRQWVKMFRPGQHQHPRARHLGVNNSGLFCHIRVHITNNQQNISFSWIGCQSCFAVQGVRLIDTQYIGTRDRKQAKLPRSSLCHPSPEKIHFAFSRSVFHRHFHSHLLAFESELGPGVN